MTFEGRLVRMRENGVGVVDVDHCDEYLYFTPKQIVGYRGETVEELQRPRHGWADGSVVVLEGEPIPGGGVLVETANLKR